ncbi:hypothetical protein [Oligoflexus tunisiensis]|uniref:hypothetical protein n=1 Tax=Oligoflexus tunisiensis TaxID=708132 RepID=UPI00114CC572|nr:hypothetical protein [Oligoflexus tunisiensis]
MLIIQKFQVLLLLLVIVAFPKEAQAQISLPEAFPGTVMDADLEPLVEQFLVLAVKAKIRFPLPNKITRIQLLPHAELMARIKSRGNIQAVAILEPDTQETEILLASELIINPIELRVLLFHELLHAAGYGHPVKDCHWAESGCGIMGQSPFPYLSMKSEHIDDVIRKSFTARYLSRLPRIGENLESQNSGNDSESSD